MFSLSEEKRKTDTDRQTDRRTRTYTHTRTHACTHARTHAHIQTLRQTETATTPQCCVVCTEQAFARQRTHSSSSGKENFTVTVLQIALTLDSIRTNLKPRFPAPFLQTHTPNLAFRHPASKLTLQISLSGTILQTHTPNLAFRHLFSNLTCEASLSDALPPNSHSKPRFPASFLQTHTPNLAFRHPASKLTLQTSLSGTLPPNSHSKPRFPTPFLQPHTRSIAFRRPSSKLTLQIPLCEGVRILSVRRDLIPSELSVWLQTLLPLEHQRTPSGITNYGSGWRN